VRGFLHWAAGTLASGSVAVPRPCDAPGHAPTDLLWQGLRHLLRAPPTTAQPARPATTHRHPSATAIKRGAEDMAFCG
jgi:hypothetical protein